VAKAKKEEVKDISTEEKIKAAAKKLFTQKGFAAVKTRDIAEESGINLALLNYYFRSKQKLFEIVMLENFRKFIHGIIVQASHENAPMEEKLEKIITAYIDFLTLNPDLPFFILNELKNNPAAFTSSMNEDISQLRNNFFKQLQQRNKKSNQPPMEPFHFVANLVGLTVFPFIGKPILQRVTHTTDAKFNALMQQRKKLIPIWLKMMMGLKMS